MEGPDGGASAAESWELSKENYVPVKAGRKKSALAEVPVDPSASSTKQALDERRKELWRDIRQYQGDDPLEPWQRLIKWTQEHLSGGKAELQKVLEQCTTSLFATGKYSNDVRFLRIWIQYADCLPDPNDVFLFLKEKGIGLDFALFYEAYATYYELRGNCSAADAVYQDGINRNAKPFDRLKQKYAAFQTRMAQRIQRRIQEEAALGPAAGSTGADLPRASLAPLVPVAPPAARPGALLPGAQASGAAGSTLLRPAAGSLPGAQPGRTGAGLLGVSRAPAAPGGGLAGLLPQQQQQQGAQGRGTGAGVSSLAGMLQPAQPPAAAGLQQPQAHGAPPTAVQLPNLASQRGAAQAAGSASGAPAVEVDAEFRPGAPRVGFPVPGYSLMPQGASNLRELKPYNVIRKENNEKPSQWVGTTLGPDKAGPQSAYAPVAPAKLDICVDDEFADENEEVEPEPAPPVNAIRHALDAPAHQGPPLAAVSSLGTTVQSQLLPGATRATGLAGMLGAAGSSGGGLAAPKLPALLGSVSQPQPAAHPASQSHLSQPQPQTALPQGVHGGPVPAAPAQQGHLVPVGTSLQQPGLRPLGALPTLQGPSSSYNNSGGAALAPRPLAALSSLPASAMQNGRPGQLLQSRAAPLQGSGVQHNGGVAPSVGFGGSGNTHVLADDEEEEVSYEERRAAAWFARRAQQQHQQQQEGSAAAVASNSRQQQQQASAGPAKTTDGAAAGSVAGAAAPSSSHAVPQQRRPLAAVPLPPSAAAPILPVADVPLASATEQGAAIKGWNGSASAGTAAQGLEAAHSLSGMSTWQQTQATGPQPGPRALPPEPTVTISTKAAFDAMNDMFGGGGSTSSSASVPAVQAIPVAKPAAKRRALGVLAEEPVAGAAAPAALPAPATTHVPDLQPLPIPGAGATGKRPASSEPTVTINTRLAFDALNDMFSDGQAGAPASTLGRQTRSGSFVIPADEDDDTHLLKMPTLPAAMKPISALDVCRLANSSKLGSSSAAPGPAIGNGPGGFGRSTGIVPNSTHAPSSSSSAFVLHEDTEFVGAPPVAALLAAAGTAAVQSSAAQQQQRRVRRSSVGTYPGLGNIAALTAGTGAAVTQGMGGGAGASSGGGGLAIYEDTEFFR